ARLRRSGFRATRRPPQARRSRRSAPARARSRRGATLRRSSTGNGRADSARRISSPAQPVAARAGLHAAPTSLRRVALERPQVRQSRTVQHLAANAEARAVAVAIPAALGGVPSQPTTHVRALRVENEQRAVVVAKGRRGLLT